MMMLKKIAMISLAALLACQGPTNAMLFNGQTTGSVAPTVAYYKTQFDTAYAANSSTITTNVNSGDGTQYYTLSYALDGTIAMYEATSNLTYLTRALGWATTMVSLATITDNAGYLNWTGDDTSNTYASVAISSALDDFQSSVPLAELADLIINTPSLDAMYDSQARTIQAFIAHNIIEKHICSLGRNENYNFVVGQFTSDKVAMLMRIVRHATNVDAAINCSGTTYLSTLNTWMTAYHARFTQYGVGTLMDRGLSQYTNRHYSSTDTSHGNRYPYAALDDWKAGNVFTFADLQKMALDFYGHIWNHSISNPEFNNFIDGTNQPFYNCDATSVCTPQAAYADGVIYLGWVTLGEIDPTAQYVGDLTLKAILANVNNPSINAMNSFWGILELSGHLAKNLLPT